MINSTKRAKLARLNSKNSGKFGRTHREKSHKFKFKQSPGAYFKTIGGASTGGGLVAVGIWILRAVINQPEPSSIFFLLGVGGILLTLLGGAGALGAFGVISNVSVRFLWSGFKLNIGKR